MGTATPNKRAMAVSAVERTKARVAVRSTVAYTLHLDPAICCRSPTRGGNFLRKVTESAKSECFIELMPRGPVC